MCLCLIRRFHNSARCRLMTAFLPAIFHQALRGLSIMVDLFLGISPSLAALLPTFVGIPSNLYGPIDVTEHFGYVSIRTPEVISTSAAVQRKCLFSLVFNKHKQSICTCSLTEIGLINCRPQFKKIGDCIKDLVLNT